MPAQKRKNEKTQGYLAVVCKKKMAAAEKTGRQPPPLTMPPTNGVVADVIVNRLYLLRVCGRNEKTSRRPTRVGHQILACTFSISAKRTLLVNRERDYSSRTPCTIEIKMTAEATAEY